MLEFAVMDRRFVGMIEAVVVVEGDFFALEVRRGRRLFDAQYVPACRFGLKNSFQLRVVVKARHVSTNYSSQYHSKRNSYQVKIRSFVKGDSYILTKYSK